MILVGLDPSLRNTGIAVADYCELTKRIVGIERIQLVSTEAGKKGKGRKNADDFNRARLLQAAIMKWVNIADCVLVEMPSGSQSARASLGSGAILGILSSIKVPMVQVQPAETKMVVGKNAEKVEIIDWAVNKYPRLPWLRQKRKPYALMNDNEHIADAIAVIHVGVEMPAFTAILARYEELDSLASESM
jgi:hypothetical protein